MDSFKSKKVSVNKRPEELFNILSDLRNLDKITPPSINMSNITHSTCSLNINNLTEVKLTISEKKPFSYISIQAENNQLPFLLQCYIEKEGDYKSQVELEINIKLNMMTKMMVEKPLKELLNQLSNKLSILK